MREKLLRKMPGRTRLQNKLIEDIRFLLELKDKSADGKWDYQTIRRIDEIGQSVRHQ